MNTSILLILDDTEIHPELLPYHFFFKHFFLQVCCLMYLFSWLPSISILPCFLSQLTCIFSFYGWWHFVYTFPSTEIRRTGRRLWGQQPRLWEIRGFILMDLSFAWCYRNSKWDCAYAVNGRDLFRDIANSLLSSHSSKLVKEEVWICSTYWSCNTKSNTDYIKRLLVDLRLETIMQFISI